MVNYSTLTLYHYDYEKSMLKWENFKNIFLLCQNISMFVDGNLKTVPFAFAIYINQNIYIYIYI